MTPVLQKAIDAIKDQSLLDRPADLLEDLFRTAVRSTGRAERQVRNFLHGTWMEHPLHPTLTDIPLGAWTAAFFMDLLSTDDRDHPNRGSDAAIAIGLAGAASAALTGMADFHHIDNPRTRRVATAHALANTTAATLYSASLLMRLAGMRGVGRNLSFAAYMVLGVGGYLGGYLVFGEKLGVRHAPIVEKPDSDEPFVPVMAASSLLDGRPVRAMAGDVPVMIMRTNGSVFAITDDCTHLGCSLAAGIVDGETIRCRCHGSRFSLADGGVIDGPATFPAAAFDVRVAGDQVEVRRRR
jgi:nitrite reductase/ring-hydroxylating ferredoxin subunit/uncharacterized membrane protein